MTFLAGALLFVCWFLPAIRSCNTDWVPVKEWVEGTQQALNYSSLTDKAANLALVYVDFTAAYWTAPLIAASAASRALGLHKHGGAALIGVLILMGLAWFIVLGSVVNAVLTGSPTLSLASPYDWLGVGLVSVLLFSPIHLIRAIRKDVPHEMALTWLIAIILFLWFTWWGVICLFDGGGLIGLWCSWVLSACLSFSVTAEAAAIAKISWWQGFRQMLFCKLHAAPLKGYCERCGYDLRGLPEPRCPECGTPFEVAV